MQERVPLGDPRKERTETQRLSSARQRTRRHARKDNWNIGIGNIGNWNCSIQLKKTSYFLDIEKEKNSELETKLEKAKVEKKHTIPAGKAMSRSLVNENKDEDLTEEEQMNNWIKNSKEQISLLNQTINEKTAKLNDANKRNANLMENERGLREKLNKERNLAGELIHRFNGNHTNYTRGEQRNYEEEIQNLLKNFNLVNMNDMEQALRAKKQLVKQLSEEKKNLERKIYDCEKSKNESEIALHEEKETKQSAVRSSEDSLKVCQDKSIVLEFQLAESKKNFSQQKKWHEGNYTECREAVKNTKALLDAEKENCLRDKNAILKNCEDARVLAKFETNQQLKKFEDDMKTVQSNLRGKITELTADLEAERETCKRKLNEQNALTQKCVEQQKVGEESNAACRKEKDELGKQLEWVKSSCLKKINEMNRESENAKQEAKKETDKSIAQLFQRINDDLNKFRKDFSGNMTSFIADVLKSEREKFKQKIYEIESQWYLRRK